MAFVLMEFILMECVLLKFGWMNFVPIHFGVISLQLQPTQVYLTEPYNRYFTLMIDS
jgi:hypothetical protein